MVDSLECLFVYMLRLCKHHSFLEHSGANQSADLLYLPDTHADPVHVHPKQGDSIFLQ